MMTLMKQGETFEKCSTELIKILRGSREATGPYPAAG